MTPEELVDILKKHHHFVAGRFNLGQRATLKNAQLRGLKLPKIGLQSAILAGADLSYCVLTEADLVGTILEPKKKDEITEYDQAFGEPENEDAENAEAEE
jgi:hypothetical protein